jgi:hypothetical protein
MYQQYGIGPALKTLTTLVSVEKVVLTDLVLVVAMVRTAVFQMASMKT